MSGTRALPSTPAQGRPECSAGGAGHPGRVPASGSAAASRAAISRAGASRAGASRAAVSRAGGSPAGASPAGGGGGRGTGQLAGPGGAGGGILGSTTLTSSQQQLYRYVSAHRDGAGYLLAV